MPIPPVQWLRKKWMFGAAGFVVLVAVFTLLRASPWSHPMMAGDIPLPFGQKGALQGSLTKFGQRNGIDVYDVAFDHSEVSEHLTNEACDDGDTDSGDGCSDACVIEESTNCQGSPSVCLSFNAYVKKLADTSKNGQVSATEALLLQIVVFEAQEKEYPTVEQYDVNRDRAVDSTDLSIVITELKILAPPSR